MGWGRLLVVVLALPGLGAAACSAGSAGHAPAGGAPTVTATPRLGGPAPSRTPGPAAMSRLERPVAARLAREARAQGLTLDRLDCPRWDGRMPTRLRCTGWFDGVPAEVRVRLHRLPGGSVSFDAALGDGVIATRNLVRRLRERGYAAADCGPRPAYPARAGLRVVCAVGTGAGRRYLVATVTDRSGAVTIAPY